MKNNYATHVPAVVVHVMPSVIPQVMLCVVIHVVPYVVPYVMYLLCHKLCHVTHVLCYMLKVHKIEIFFGSEFEFCTISLLVLLKY